MRKKSARNHRSYHSPGRRKAPHHVIITRGEKIRSFTVRPLLATLVATAIVAVLGVYVAATAYLFFRDDILAASVGGNADLRQKYEERIAELRSQLDRVTSRQVVDQDAIAARLRTVMGRQEEISERQQILTGLSASVREAGLHPEAPAGEERRALAVPAGAKAGAGVADSGEPDDAAEPAAPADDKLAALESALDRMEGEQVAVLQAVASEIAAKNDSLAKALISLGAPVRDDAIGGPFEPLDPAGSLEDFRERAETISESVDRLAELSTLARGLPLARPIEDVAITSRFGRRLDPFLGRPAMHTGVDFRAPSGKPVRATAPGKVVLADRSGGYGKMVEIDHGNGITTRYGHLSRISVREGQTIAAGEVIGRVGSTGRSTGPHLHYEVRRGGRALDPMVYIRAGAEIAELL